MQNIKGRVYKIYVHRIGGNVSHRDLIAVSSSRVYVESQAGLLHFNLNLKLIDDGVLLK
jgi:hypothetical protein